MTKENLKTIALLILSAFLVWGYIRDDNSIKKGKSSNDITENIKLYSNGKLIGQWQGIGKGNFDGQTYSFRTNEGAYAHHYRIKGDFIIETEPQ